MSAGRGRGLFGVSYQFAHLPLIENRTPVRGMHANRGFQFRCHSEKIQRVLKRLCCACSLLSIADPVIQSNASYNSYLTKLSDELGLTVASVESRLAPENPYPAGYNDAVDAALFVLSDDGEEKLGAPLRVLGGESAGGWFVVAVALALRDKHGVNVKSQLSAICAGYSIFGLTYTPSCLDRKRNIVLSSDLMQRYVEAGFARIPMRDRKTPEVSPQYADLTHLPPAQFLVGNIDPLLDDSIFMASKWANAGNEADLHIVDGACHAFTLC